MLYEILFIRDVVASKMGADPSYESIHLKQENKKKINKKSNKIQKREKKKREGEKKSDRQKLKERVRW